MAAVCLFYLFLSIFYSFTTAGNVRATGVRFHRYLFGCTKANRNKRTSKATRNADLCQDGEHIGMVPQDIIITVSIGHRSL